MDDNTRDVLATAVTVAATLGGIWLGWILQSRHRHDDEKRRVYVTYLSEYRRSIEGLVRGEQLVDTEGQRRRLLDQATELHILGGRAVTDASLGLNRAFTAWVEGLEAEGDADRKRLVDQAMTDLLIAIRRDLGSGPL